MALELPISIVAVDDVAHDLTRLAIEDTLRIVSPKQVLIFTDDPAKLKIPGADYGFFPGGYYNAMEALWLAVPQRLAPQSTHMLWVQWDSWALDAAQWTDDFLEYDYIGAPWPIAPGNKWDQLGYTKDTNVGNGGFSLRSVALVKHIKDNAHKLPLSLPEDDAICRHLRPALSQAGFRWAPATLAARFSFECENEIRPSFGFHNCIHWPSLLSPAALERRLAMATPWVKNHPTFSNMLAVKQQSQPVSIYNPSVFNVASQEHAKAIILTADGTRTPEQRWEIETPWIMGLLREHFPKDGSSVLDFGCGIGRLSKPLISDRAFTSLGVDISASMRALAVEYVKSPVFLCCAPEPATQMITWGARCDYALATWALQHSANPLTDIAMLHLAIRPGGRLFVLNANMRFVPTGVGWVDDGKDVWGMFTEGWRCIARELPDPSIVSSNPPAEWAIFERLA